MTAERKSMFARSENRLERWKKLPWVPVYVEKSALRRPIAEVGNIAVDQTNRRRPTSCEEDGLASSGKVCAHVAPAAAP